MPDLVYPPIIGLVRAGFAGLGIRFDITGVEQVPRTGGAVLAVNHIGYLDFTFAGLAALRAKRLVRFMAKKEIFDHPVAGPLMRGMRHIEVDRTGAAADSYHRAVAALSAGEIVGVFPEATISESYELKEFKTGTVRLALAAGVPVLPCVLWGSQRILTKGRPRDLTRGTPVRIIIGEPYVLPASSDPVRATADLRARMGVLLEQARSTYTGAPRSPDDTWWFPRGAGGTAPTIAEAAERNAARVRERAAEQARRRR